MDTNIKYNNFENDVANVTVETISTKNNGKAANAEENKTSSSSIFETCFGFGQRCTYVLPIIILILAMLTLLASLVLIVSVSKDAAVTKVTTLAELSQLKQDLKNSTNVLLNKLKMKNTLQLCAKGYNCVDSRNTPHEQLRCFNLNTTGSSWHEARSQCRDAGGFLAEVHDYPTLDFLKSYLRTSLKPARHDVWLGGTDNTTENLWLWDATRISLTSVWNWEGNSCVLPSYEILKKDCLKIDARTGKWCHEACSERRPFLCQKEGDACESSGWN